MLSQRPGKGRKWLVLPWNNKKKSNKIKGKNTFLQYQGIVREYVKIKTYWHGQNKIGVSKLPLFRTTVRTFISPTKFINNETSSKYE